MARNSDMMLPEDKGRPQSITFKPLPGNLVKEKVIKQRDGDFVVLNPI